MAVNVLNTRVATCNDTAANWAESTKVLLKGELAVEWLDDGVWKLKIGNGIDTFKNLPYLPTGDGTIRSISVDGVALTIDPDTKNVNIDLSGKADLESPIFTGNPTAPTPSATDNSSSIATTEYVAAAIEKGLATYDALVYKGVITGETALDSTKLKVGETFIVGVAGEYFNHQCEIGDMLIVQAIDKNDEENPVVAWDVIQTNIDGAVAGPESALDLDIPVFNGTTGKLIKDSGKKLSDFTYTADDITLQLANNQFSIKAVSTDLLTQGANTLVLDCGNSSTPI